MAIDIGKKISSTKAQKEKEGSNVVLAGWAADVKSLGKIAFIKLRDREGIIQIVTSNQNLIKKIEALHKESVILVQGKIKKSKLKAGGNEIELEDFEILSASEPKLPIELSGKIETDLSKRLDWRFLDLRNPKHLAIFKIRAKICQAIREFLIKEGFIEMQTPKIVGTGAEGGATLFVLDYFGKPAYLAQSQQIYKQMMNIAGFEKIFEIGPSFRAEKSHTTRHMTEFTQLDLEFSFIKNEEDIFKLGENLLVYVLEFVKKNCKPELELLNVKIEIPKTPFPRITYKDAIELLKENKVKINFGEDIGTAEEKIVGDIIKKKYKSFVYFLTQFPWELEVCKFYWMRNGNVGRGGDLEFNGQELFTGGQREHRYNILVKQLKEKNLNPKDFEYYLTPFKYGAPPHGGFGLGIDRLTEYILGLENVREATLFPRDPERIIP
jgi:aspartyl-tRNA synthetase